MCKLLSLFAITLLFCSCKTQQQRKASTEIITIATAPIVSRAVDSLQKVGVDTLLIYRVGCSGCIKGIYQSKYVFWLQHGYGYVLKVDNYVGLHKAIWTDPTAIKYFWQDERLVKMNRDTMYAPDMMHYWYSELKLVSPQQNITIEVPDSPNAKEGNPKEVLEWIYRIQSALFRMELDKRRIF